MSSKTGFGRNYWCDILTYFELLVRQCRTSRTIIYAHVVCKAIKQTYYIHIIIVVPYMYTQFDGTISP